MAQDLESEVKSSDVLSQKVLLSYRGHLLKLYLDSLNGQSMPQEEKERYQRIFDGLNLPQRLYFLNRYLLQKDSFSHSSPLANYFRRIYIATNGGRSGVIQENTENEFFRNRTLVLIKGNKK